MDQKIIRKVMKGVDNLVEGAKYENDTILEFLRQLQSKIKNGDILHRGFVAEISGYRVLVLADKIIFKESDDETTYKLDQLKNLYEKDKYFFLLVMKGIMSGEAAFSLIPNTWEIASE
ncbi:MAG: hypothetical protein MUC28_00460 [Planctomycetes bacterium]|jgi:hypothetical protein|nr:hypothetical protein [Planctomycetota bacterium]